ncbi:MAG TPA: PKD domain-containing protein [Tenuifilaceae bacterium]|nr:PKD domain-containing protein [Tenuifilaceae bacterium]
MRKFLFLFVCSIFLLAYNANSQGTYFILTGANQSTNAPDVLLLSSANNIAYGSSVYWYVLDDRSLPDFQVLEEIVSIRNNWSPTIPSTYYSSGTYILASTYSLVQGQDVSNEAYSLINFNGAAATFNAGSISKNKTYVCYGDNVTLTVSPTGGTNYSYQWYKSENNGFTWTLFGDNSNSVTAIGLNKRTYFRCRITSTNPNYSRTTPALDIQITGVQNYGVVASIGIGGTSATSTELCYNLTPSAVSDKSANTWGTGSYTYQWQKSLDNSSWGNINTATNTSYQPSNLTETTYYRKIVTDASCGSRHTNSVVYSVFADVVSGTIGSNQSICYGSTPVGLSFSSLPSGGNGGFTYQWQSSTDNVNFSDISGATNISYQPQALTQTTYFRCTQINSCKTVYSNTVTITVYADEVPATINSSQTICYNIVPSLLSTVTPASGGNGSFTYQWQSSTDNVNFSDISGATNISYQPQALTQTTYFKLKQQSCKTVYSNTVTITVYADVLAGSITGNQSICYNTVPNPILSSSLPSGGNGSFTYQWQSSTDNVNFSDISGATGATYQPQALTQTTYFKRKEVTSCKTVYSNTVTITVFADVVIGTIGSNQTICNGSTPAEFTPAIVNSGGNGSFTYQWQSSLNGTDYIDISGGNGANYQAGVLTQTTYFRKKVISSCKTGFTNVVTVTVKNSVNSGSIGADQTLCYYSMPFAINELSGASGGSGDYTYSWESSLNNVDWSVIPAASMVNYQPNNLAVTTYFRRKVTDLTCGSAYSNIVTITVRPILNVGTIGDNETICYSTSPSAIVSKVNPSGGTGNYTYLWERTTDGSSWTEIAGTNTPTYQPNILTQTTIYRRKLTDLCGVGYSNKDTVFVRQPLLSGSIGSDQTICYGSAPSDIFFTSTPSGGTGNYTYQWESSSNGIDFASLSGKTSNFLSVGNLTADKFYRVKVTSEDCGTVTTNTVKISVLSDFNSGSIGSDQTICYGSTPSTLVNIASPVGSDNIFSYRWQFLAGVNWTDIENSNTPNFIPSSINSTTIFRRVAVNACGEKVSNSVTVTVRPEFKAGTIGSNQSINFNGVPSQLVSLSSPSGGAGSYSYQWQLSSDNSAWSVIDGQNQEAYQPLALVQTTYFRRKVTDAICGEAFTNSVTINVLNSLNGGSILDNQTICYDTKPAKLTGTPASGGVGTFAYQWKKSTDNSTYADVVGATEQDYQPINLTQSTYFKRLASLGGQTVESNKVFIEVRPALSEPNTDLKGRYCKNSTATVTVTDVETGIKYNWYSSSNALLSVGSQFSISSFAEETSLFVQKEDVQGCLSTKKSLTLRVDNVLAQFSADKASIKQGEKVTFTNSSVGGNSYSWNFGDGVVSPEFSPVHYFHKVNGNQPTAYSVSLVVTSQFGCTSSEVKNDLVVVNPLTSDVGDNSASSFRVFPSPVSEWLNVACEDGVSSLDVFSIGGELVGRFVGSDKLLTVNLSHLSNGVYIAKAYSQKGYVFVAKFIKQ